MLNFNILVCNKCKKVVFIFFFLQTLTGLQKKIYQKQ